MSTIISDALDWCQCGEPDKVDEMMLAYLRWCRDGWPDGTDPSDPATMLLGYIAESRDWTEHGTTVWHSWLTDHGKEILSRLEATMLDSLVATRSVPAQQETPGDEPGVSLCLVGVPVSRWVSTPGSCGYHIRLLVSSTIADARSCSALRYSGPPDLSRTSLMAPR